MLNCAVVTMVYNEATYLPIWCRYYGGIFGERNCFVIDHGSDDGSTDGLAKFNLIRLPRSPMDDEKRTRFVSSLCNNLLKWYDAYIYIDVDEILIARPGKYADLSEYVNSRGSADVISAYGFDLHQDIRNEPPIMLDAPVLKQRKWLRFASSMCKTVLSYREIEWSPGFHSANHSLRFGEVYLFHLRYFDLQLGLQRLRRTREMPWAGTKSGSHQRLPDEDFEDLMRRVSGLSKIPGGELCPDTAPLHKYVQQVLASETDFGESQYNINLGIFGNELIEVPTSFRDYF